MHPNLYKTLIITNQYFIHYFLLSITFFTASLIARLVAEAPVPASTSAEFLTTILSGISFKAFYQHLHFHGFELLQHF